MHPSRSRDALNAMSTAEDGRSRILRAAAKLFKNQGYAATALRQIAAESGMKAGSIYYHFESKDAILAEVLHIGVQRVFDQVKLATAELYAGNSAYQLFHAAVLAHLTTLHESIDFSSANIRIFGQAPSNIKHQHMPLRKSYENYWLSLFQRCQKIGGISPDSNLSLDNFLLLGLMNSTLEWFPVDGISIDELATQISMKFVSPNT